MKEKDMKNVCVKVVSESIQLEQNTLSWIDTAETKDLLQNKNNSKYLFSIYCLYVFIY